MDFPVATYIVCTAEACLSECILISSVHGIYGHG